MRLAAQCLRQDGVEVAAQGTRVGAVGTRAGGGGLAFEDGLFQTGEALSPHRMRQPTGEQLIQEHTERIHVGRHRDGFAADLLG